MKKIKSIKVIDNQHIMFEFVHNETKILVVSTIWNYPVFMFLKQESNISKLQNNGTNIAWNDFEADLSADTIWNLAK